MSEYEIVFICSHRNRKQAGDEVEVILTTEIDGDPGQLTGQSVSPTAAGTRLELDCTTCGRCPQIRGIKAVKLYDGLLDFIRAGQRRVEVDICDLPF